MKQYLFPLTFIRRFIQRFIQRSFSAVEAFSVVGLTLTLTLTVTLTSAQQGEWTWMHGDSTGGSLGHYGVQGVSDPLNEPPSADEIVSWVDLQGNLWLFGGEFAYGDLWKYDVTTDEWTWVKGPGIGAQSGVYGTLGIPSGTNLPGGRSRAASWVDSSGHLWLFGGIGFDAFGIYSYLDDLWMYDISTNEWTWMKGSNSSGRFLLTEPTRLKMQPTHRGLVVKRMPPGEISTITYGFMAGRNFRIQITVPTAAIWEPLCFQMRDPRSTSPPASAREPNAVINS